MSIYSVIDHLHAGESDRWFIVRLMPRGGAAFECYANQFRWKSGRD